MALLAQRNLLLAKIEAAIGTDADPTAAADAMLVSDLDLTPFEATEIDRALYRPYLGASPVVHDAVHQSLRFGVELAGSGAADTAPPYDALLRASGFVESDLGPSAAVAASVEWGGITFTADDAGAAGNHFRLVHGASETAPSVFSRAEAGGVITITIRPGMTAQNATRAGIVRDFNAADETDGVTAAVTDGAGAWAHNQETHRLAGGADAVVGGSSYKPRSDGFESATIYCNRAGNLHKLTAARGNVSLRLEPGQIPRMSFTFLGRHSVVTYQALPANVDYSAFQKPVQPTRSDVLTIGGAAVTGASLSLDAGQQVTFLQWLNDDAIEITGREATGELVLRDPGVKERNYFADVSDQTVSSIVYILGDTPGNTIEVRARAQLAQPRYGEREGVQTLQLGLRVLPSDAGNDELEIRVR